MTQKKSLFESIPTFLARTDLFFFSLFWLMFLVVAGTLAQREIGLYQAQQKYFSSFYFMLGPIPLPGAYPTMGVTFIGLVAKLTFFGKWNRQSLGVNITHFGAILLLLGGYLTAAFSREGNLTIPENESRNYITDYHVLELAVTETTAPDHNHVIAFEDGWLQTGKTLRHADLPFTLEILDMNPNNEILRRDAAPPEDAKGFLKIFSFRPAPTDKDDFKNTAAVQFKIHPLDPSAKEIEGAYGLFELMPVTQTLKVGPRNFTLELRKARTPLPFSVRLFQFKKETYPSTEMAKSYSSRVEVQDGAVTQKSLIQMNQPLRYKGYTFYQSSFSEAPGGKTSIFAVVKNVGAIFPYISSLVMSLGLLIHLVSKIPLLIAGKGRQS